MRTLCLGSAVWGHTVSVGVGAGGVETLDSTDFTEGVLGDMCVECISCQLVQTLGKRRATQTLLT